MLFHEDAEGHVIIGEAVMQLALSGKAINIASLLTELNRMAEKETSKPRQMDTSNAVGWLRKFAVNGGAEQPVPHLQTLAGLNEEKH